MPATLLDLAMARLTLGLVLREELPAAASRALEDGLDSPSMRLLAGLSDAELDEATPLLQKSIVELGLSLPSKSPALVVLARSVARRILDEKVSPSQGATEIKWLWKNGGHPQVDQRIGAFIWDADIAAATGTPREAIDRAIMDAARALVTSE